MASTEVSPRTTLAIILGASEWPSSPDLAASEAFARSARGVRDYLLDENGFGLPEANLLNLFDKDSAPSRIDEEISTFLETRDNDLKQVGSAPTDVVVYYVGHGGFTGKGHDYFLAIRATRRGSEGISSIRIRDLAATLENRSPRPTLHHP